jgi:hypothetical protein
VSAVSAAAALGLRPVTTDPDLFTALLREDMASQSIPGHEAMSTMAYGCMTAAELSDLHLDLDDAAYERRMRADTVAKVEWTESEIAGLHWELLREVGALADPKTPLAEKLDTLDWVLRDPKHDDEPFSFAYCVRVVSSHVAFEDFIQARERFQAQLAQENSTGRTEARRRMPPTDHLGHIDVDTLRLYVQVHARQWLLESLEQLPADAQAYFRARPGYVAGRLVSNPQFLNELVSKARRQTAEQGPGLFDDLQADEGGLS